MHPPPTMFRRRRPCRGQRGFTLVELVISAGLLAFLAAIATYFWVDNFRLVLTLDEDSAAISDGRAVLERISREIREVKYDTAAGAFCISTMAANQIVFNKTSGSYLPGCGGATPTATHNDFAVSIQPSATDNTLTLTYSGTLAPTAGGNPLTAPITAKASAINIVYLDKNSVATASPASVKFVQLTLKLQPLNTPLGAPSTQTRTLVALRNN